MDIDAARTAKDNEIRTIEAYLDHPISKEILRDNEESQSAMMNLVLEVDVDSLASLVAHFVAVGHLRGLKQASVQLHSSLEELKRELAEIK